jgi:hypothetical protein
VKTPNTSIEIADIFSVYGHLLGRLPLHHHKVIQAIKNCRTSVLGGHSLKCDSCEFNRNAYNSCRNRHCPKCGFTARTRWIEKRTEELFDCPYFHVVFTLPAEFRPLILQNQKLCYDLLFKASSETLKEVAANPKNLGAEIGCIGVLHTWAQNLLDHPHIHFIVPGGGLSKDRSKWIASKKEFFVPVKILSKVFRAKFLEYVEEAFDQNKFKLTGPIADLSSYSIFKPFIKSCASKEFVVYCKKPFAGPKQVINYLGQYTHRIAISNYRLVKVEEGRVYFKVRDKETQNKKKIMSLTAEEFMRRFLLHVLPRGFVRIRHFGLLGSRFKQVKVTLVRSLQGLKKEMQKTIEENWKSLLKKTCLIDADKCPSCSTGILVKATIFLPTISTA